VLECLAGDRDVVGDPHERIDSQCARMNVVILARQMRK
jgi:hypothetical protein